MANPSLVSVPKKTWTKVVDNKTVGWIYAQGVFSSKLKTFFEFMDTGEAAPTLTPFEANSKAIKLEGDSLPLNRSLATDVYFYTLNSGLTVIVDAI